MDNLQATIIEPSGKFKSRLLDVFLFVNFVAVIVAFVLNFLGLPILKYHYLIHVMITFAAIMLFDFSQIFPMIITLFFLEGQGRILWEYADWARIVFDSLVFLSVLKIFVIKRKVIDLKKIPPLLVFIISLHFLWFALEFSNLYSISTFSTFASTKIYIYPILLFFGLIQLDYDVFQRNFQKSVTFLIVILTLELALTFYQFNMKENLILQISPYYSNPMRDNIFMGEKYRPFATTNLPGAISIFLFLTVGFLFLRKKSKLGIIINTILISASSLAFVYCQVRSAFIKFILIILTIQLGELIYFRLKSKQLVGFIILLIAFSFGSTFISDDKLASDDASLNYARDRVLSIKDYDKIKSSRLNIETFVKIITKKITDHPLGIGPGMTGAAGKDNLGNLTGNRFINIDTIWASDNFFISLIIDFGIGAIFYILMLLYIPTYFLRFLIIFYKNKIYDSYKVLLVSFSTIVVTIIGNWGAVGITYNPESFIFWFFAALGFSTIAKYKNSVVAVTENALK